MKTIPEIHKRKPLKNRCPKCGSSQIRHRKFLDTWKCQDCDNAFKEPACDPELKS